MDGIHEELVIVAALAFVAYVQLPDVSPTNATNVVKPQIDGEETAPMFDEKLEAVFLVEESETLIAYLNACTKETGMDHHVLETIEASDSLGVSFGWALETSREERVLVGRN